MSDFHISAGIISSVSRVGNLLISFSSNLVVFCERKRDSHMKKSESLPSLFCTEQMSKERREQFDLNHKKGKNCQKQTKNMNFSSDLLVFASNLLESRAKHLLYIALF